MANLFELITTIFRRERAQTNGQTTADAFMATSEESSLAQRFTAEHERTRIVEACRAMYKQDPRAKKMIRTLARDMTKGGFTVKCSNNRATEIAQGLYRRLDLEKKLDDWVRLTARDGDSFLEVVVNERLEIVDVSRKPTLYVHRNSDRFDRFPDPNRAYWMSEKPYLSGDLPKDAIWFADWQIVHARWEHDEGTRYGTPMMSSGISAWRKVTEGETDIAVRRKTRSGMRFLHVIEGATKEQIQEYKERNKAALSANAAIGDFFSSRPGAITAIQGDATLSEIADVRHHIQTWMTSGDVPMELIAYGEDLNRDVLTNKQEEYQETLEQLRAWVVSEIVRPVLERQWLLMGILPEGLDYEISWKAQAAVTPRDVLDVADAAMRLRLLGLPEEIIWGVLARFLPGIDAEMLSKSTTIPDSGGDPDRVARILAGFAGGG